MIIVIIKKLYHFSEIHYFDFFVLFFIQPSGNIDMPGSPYSLQGYSGLLGDRLRGPFKLVVATQCNFVTAAQIRVNTSHDDYPVELKGAHL
jgi:hypothetical protein